MASITQGLQFPFPTNDDPVDVAGDIMRLADDIDTKLNLYFAKLNSPTFSGTPQSTTAVAGTSTKQIATTEFVMSQTFVTQSTLTSYVLPYAKIASPTFTGTANNYEGGFRGKLLIGAVDSANIAGGSKPEEYLSASSSFGGTLTLGRQITPTDTPSGETNPSWSPRIDFRSSGTTTTSVDSRIFAQGGNGNIGSGKIYMVGKTFLFTPEDLAPLNLAHRTAPTSPVNGDMWTTTDGVYSRINSFTHKLVTDSELDSVSQLALTAFQSYMFVSSPETSDYTATTNNTNSIIRMNNSGTSAITFTVPENTFSVGTHFTVVQYGTGPVTIAGDNFSIDSKDGYDTLDSQYSVATIVKVEDPDVWIAYGDLTLGA